MATKALSRTKNRQRIAALNAALPDKARNCIVRPIYPDSELASIRQRRAAREENIDCSNLGWMLPHNRSKLQRELAAARDGYFDWRNNADDRQKLSSLIVRSANGDAEATRELASYQQFVIHSDILATPFALTPFQSINLSGDELPQIITPKTRQYFKVGYIGQDGGARFDQWRTTKSATEIEMRMASTPRVEYPLIDLQQGSVVELDKINAQLRYDMEMQIDEWALASLNAGLMESGIRDLIQLHPKIPVENIPDTNILDLRDEGTYGPAGVWTITRLKAVLHHFAQWGFNLDPDGPATLSTMMMSPLNARDAWDYVDLVSGYDSSATFGRNDPVGTVTKEQRQQILSSGGLMNTAWGMNWQTMFNPMIVKGEAWCFTNQPVGWYFTKTEFDRTIEWKDTPDAVEQNIGQILYRKALQFYQPQLWAYRYAKVLFGEEE